MESILARYARLLVRYCLELQPGERLFVQSTTLAEPLVREVYREALRAGALVETHLSFREQGRIFYREASNEQLDYVPLPYRQAMEEFEAYLRILAPFNLREEHANPPEKVRRRQAAFKPYQERYFQRTATRELKRNLCQYPTIAAAQEAGMSLEEYETFVFQACRLHEPDPVQAWLEVRRHQQAIVDFLQQRTHFRYRGPGTDLHFRTEGRRWINSDGQTNMPSGEVFTSPVEDSVEGVVHFSYPAIYMGHEVEGVTLYVEKGEVVRWEARRGKEFLDRIFELPGARRFGEAAIGTNPHIDRFTKNILFDEKIGGTVHLALGQSYLQAGGKNTSPIHWDMIADMRPDGEIFADGEKIYQGGRFLFLDS